MTAPSITRLDLLLLGLLLDRPMHGYELYQQIQAEGIDAWFNLSMAGVYYSLGKLHEQGLVLESRQAGGRTAGRSTYRLTEAGREAFSAALEEQAAAPGPVYLEYDLVLYLLSRLPLPRALALLQGRCAYLAEQVRAAAAELAAEGREGRSPLRLALLDHRRRYLEMEAAWLEDVLRDVQGESRAGAGAGAERRGLMVLRGDLRHYHLPDLIRLVASGGLGGTLTVSDGARVRSVTFEAGRPVCASARRDGVPDPAARTAEAVYDLFRWQEGSFTFDQSLPCVAPCVPLSLSADGLILEGCRWVDNWSIIQRLVPSADSIFEPDWPAERLDSLALTPLEREVVGALDGVQDVAAVARGLGRTVFETSRTLYALSAVGAVRLADLDKIRLRRVFREIAELLCSSTAAWRTSPDDRTCEEEVNRAAGELPLCLNRGRIEDQADPHLKMEELVEVYRRFLRAQLEVVARRFGAENARASYERTLRQLAPELQEVAHRYGLDAVNH